MPGLKSGRWRILDRSQIDRLFAGGGTPGARSRSRGTARR
jgi:hypothetical protein